jgi:hypothetical protein
MSKLTAHAKALPFFWMAKKVNAVRKFSQALGALGPAQVVPEASTAQGQRTVLIFSSMGVFADQLVVDTLLGRELQRQGARVIVVLCDAQMPACHVSDRYAYAFALGASGRARRQRRMCRTCTESTQGLRRDSGLTYASFSDGLVHARSAPGSGMPLDVADEVNSGVIRFAASSHPSVLQKLPDDVRRNYAIGADVAAQAIQGLFDKYRPDVVIAHHGIYLPQGVVQKVARQRQVTFYSWHFGYRKSTLIFSRGDTYHRELTYAQPAAFEQPLREEQVSRISKYLRSRVTGGQDWIHFNRTPKPFSAGGAKRGYFVCYTSVDWDAALHFPASVFSSQFDFLDKLIGIFAETPDYDLVIRVHPAEVTGFHPAALSVQTYLADRILPPNVKIIGPADTTSSYDLAENCVASIVYNTKLGIELPPGGIPVIVAGDCWIRDKGFSYDVNSLEDLEGFIRNAADLTVTAEQRARALQFAYYFYYRRCIDTPELTSGGPKFQVAVSADGVLQAREKGQGIVFIADRILHSQDIMLPA